MTGYATTATGSATGPATSAAAILAHARAVLDGTLPVPKARAPRAAALLARQALEDTVRALCRSVGVDLDRATTRSQLIGIRVLLGATVADIAEVAWSGLSRACHHHAYELAPTEGEVRHLIALVSTLTTYTVASTAPGRDLSFADLRDVQLPGRNGLTRSSSCPPSPHTMAPGSPTA